MVINSFKFQKNYQRMHSGAILRKTLILYLSNGRSVSLSVSRSLGFSGLSVCHSAYLSFWLRTSLSVFALHVFPPGFLLIFLCVTRLLGRFEYIVSLTNKREKYRKSSFWNNEVWMECQPDGVSSNQDLCPRFRTTVLSKFISNIICNRQIVIPIEHIKHILNELNLPIKTTWVYTTCSHLSKFMTWSNIVHA